MSADAIPRPLPLMTGMTEEFYQHCAAGELRFQRCSDCGTWRHVPRELCAACRSFEWAWDLSSGKGRVFTWTVVVRPLHPAFSGQEPYAPVVVEMEEGVRVLARVMDCTPEELEMDMPVEVDFEDAGQGVTLPVFKRTT